MITILTLIPIGYILYILLTLIFFGLSEANKYAVDYRIVKTTYKNNEVDYTIQQRFAFIPFWLYCHRLIGIENYQRVTFDTEKEARDYLKRNTDMYKNDDNKIIKQEII